MIFLYSKKNSLLFYTWKNLTWFNRRLENNSDIYNESSNKEVNFLFLLPKTKFFVDCRFEFRILNYCSQKIKTCIIIFPLETRLDNCFYYQFQALDLVEVMHNSENSIMKTGDDLYPKHLNQRFSDQVSTFYNS